MTAVGDRGMATVGNDDGRPLPALPASLQFNSTVVHPNKKLELVPICDSNNKYHVHPNNRIEMETISFPSQIWNFSPIQFHGQIMCIQTQHKCKTYKRGLANLQ
jgi:hypothetical protein